MLHALLRHDFKKGYFDSPGQPPEEVSCVAWNRQVQHILASNFAARCVVWDLRKNEPIIKISDSMSQVSPEASVCLSVVCLFVRARYSFNTVCTILHLVEVHGQFMQWSHR